jgi:TRAP-type mannitol/chloroaromatic compound transport system substrate-binding protein
MKRRDLLTAGAAVAAGAGVVGVLAAGEKAAPAARVSDIASPNINRGIKQFRMATSWPKDFPGLGIMPERFADALRAMSDGTLDVKVYAAGELVGATECFDACQTGSVDMYHAAEYYWQGKSKAFNFFTAVPNGMTAAEIMGWIEFGGGQALWDELSNSFNIQAFQAGNTGHQTGGWFRKEMNSLEDFRGLKIRMPGLGGEVIRRLGGSAVRLAGGEIYQALQSGSIDATEWVGPWNDLALGLYREAPYYYAPGFHEPGASLSVGINLQVWNGLSASEQAMVKVACKAANDSSLGEYTVRNGAALDTLREDHGITPRLFSQEIMARIGRISEDVVAELADADDLTARIYQSYLASRNSTRRWTEISDGRFIAARQVALDE